MNTLLKQFQRTIRSSSYISTASRLLTSPLFLRNVSLRSIQPNNHPSYLLTRSFSSIPGQDQAIKNDQDEIKFCSGCGSQIQTEEPTKVGYCPQNILETRSAEESKILCQRCYQVYSFDRFVTVRE